MKTGSLFPLLLSFLLSLLINHTLDKMEAEAVNILRTWLGHSCYRGEERQEQRKTGVQEKTGETGKDRRDRKRQERQEKTGYRTGYT